MNRTLGAAVWPLLLVLSSLAACGGGGDDAVAAADRPPAPSADGTACFPDQATFDKLNLGASVAAVEKLIGCPGYAPDANANSAGDRILQWIDPADDARSLELRFASIGLVYKSGYFIAKDHPPSACVPTQAKFNDLQSGTDYAGTVSAFGCEGDLRVEIVSFNVHEKRYMWGSDGDLVRPSALVTFLNGKVAMKYGSRLR